MDAKIQDIIKKSSVGGLGRIHQTATVHFVAERLAEIVREQIGATRHEIADAILEAVGIEP